jgi:hypothetical protein
MENAQRKVRSWCEECEAWHPRGEHIADAAPQPPVGLRAEPRPMISSEGAPRDSGARSSRARSSGLLRFAIFLFVILPVGVVAWSAAAYAVMLLLPHIKAVLP